MSGYVIAAEPSILTSGCVAGAETLRSTVTANGLCSGCSNEDRGQQALNYVDSSIGDIVQKSADLAVRYPGKG